MGPLRLTAFLAAAALALPAAGSAATQHVLPPGSSAANQYTETMPGAGGNTPTGALGGKHPQSPAKALGTANAKRLEALGPEGRAAAQLAAATAPGETAGPRSKRVAHPAGGSGFNQVLSQISGSSDSGGMGMLLTVFIAIAAIAAMAFLFSRRRAARSHN